LAAGAEVKKPAPPPPIPLDAEALAFWQKHYRRLKRDGVLTRNDVESFAILCLTWGKVQSLAHYEPGADNYREMIQLVNLLKQYQSLAKQFGLLPRERKAAKMEAPAREKKDEFGL
jgi:phage terminase small subunit